MHIDWTAVGAIAVACQTIVLAAALLYGLRQAKASVDLQRLEGLQRIHDELHETRSERRWFYQELPDDPNELDEETWDRLGDLLTRFDRIAVLCESGLVDEDLLFRSHASPIVRMWLEAERFVRHRRGLPGQTTFVEHFERLGGRAHKALTAEQRVSVKRWQIRRANAN